MYQRDPSGRVTPLPDGVAVPVKKIPATDGMDIVLTLLDADRSRADWAAGIETLGRTGFSGWTWRTAKVGRQGTLARETRAHPGELLEDGHVWLVVHLPFRQQAAVRTEVVTRPIALEEGPAKLIAPLIHQFQPKYMEDGQWAYPKERGAAEAARAVAMALELAEGTVRSPVVYSRDRSNASGTVDQGGAAHLLMESGVPASEAVRPAGLRGEHQGGWSDGGLAVGVFQGSPLGPHIYLSQGTAYMQAVGPRDTGLPLVLIRNGRYQPGTERYSDDAVGMLWARVGRA